MRYRYEYMWLPTRSIRVTEPLVVAVVCAWLAYGSTEKAREQAVAAAVMGALLGVSCAVSAALLATGLIRGGAWRKLPTSLPWSILQKLEALPVVLHAAVLSHWSYRIGRLESTPVFAMLVSIAFIVHASLLQPGHIAAVVITIFAHHYALIIYEALTLQSSWSSGQPGTELRWISALQVFVVVIIAFGFSLMGTLPVIEGKRRKDFYVHTRAKLLRNVAHDLVVNFLPAPVMKAVQERASHAAAPSNSPNGVLDDSEIVAWAYDPACVLQSDIVGFTALGSRISPQELCRWVPRLGHARLRSADLWIH